ncbi:hypothetical protein Cgig2_026504 [Carnegiea gigantea]|uniref:UVR domain-containing protein n=1 Tax=Carnegiea gigantea TaxID=171969 RepID=A0A9Q1KGZ1_9CARY|nr:hypothetical protein Cgig2_026504 [Carnegiea gigantea]
MGTLQGPVICPTVHAKQVSVHPVPANSSLTRTTMLKSSFWGYKDACRRRTTSGVITRPLHVQRLGRVHCTFSSSSDGSGSRVEKFNENDEDYINSSVIEAVEVKSGSDGFTIKMRDGRFLKCVHNSPQGGHLPDYVPHPAIVLKMEDGTDILLPIIARPTMYQVIKEMIEKMGYEVKLVRITERVHEAYFAQIYLTKAQCCKLIVAAQVPIQVNKNLAHSDGMKMVESAKSPALGPASDDLLFTELDRYRHWTRPSDKPCIETIEFNLLRNMLDAAGEERYKDAAQWRDRLTELRARRNWA